MKKSFLFAALCAATLTASAQTTVKGDKFFDNWFIGINGGVYEPTVGQNVFGDMRGMIGLELGRWFTPTVGLKADVHSGIKPRNGNNKTFMFEHDGHTFFDFVNVYLDGMINLNNLFGGYKGQPRPFEVIFTPGFGWQHMDGLTSFSSYGYAAAHGYKFMYDNDHFAGRLGFDLNWNVTDALAITFKPAINYCFVDVNRRPSRWAETAETRFDVRKSYLTLQAGLVYKFKNSNGTHNFVLANEGIDPSELEACNNRINQLKNDYEGKINNLNRTISDLRNQLESERNKKVTTTTTQLAPVVIFDQAKSIINPSQKPSVQMIATYMKNHPEAKVTIKGYASIEGNKDFNQKLSERRADAVYNMLTKTYKIDASRLKKVGLGPTTEIFDERDWNRVCIFVEE